jgi:hypothetical protein
VASHWRMRVVRSPDVGAEKAPPVSRSSGCASALLAELVLAADAGAGVVSALDLDMGKGNIKMTAISSIKTVKKALKEPDSSVQTGLFAHLKIRQSRIFAVFTALPN